jgi:hypothetical protein
MKYCPNCGSQLKQELVGAEKIKRCYESGCYYPESPFDEKSGKRKYAYKYTCPKKRWYNNCVSYVEDKTIYE